MRPQRDIVHNIYIFEQLHTTRLGHGSCWVFVFMTRILSTPRNPPQSLLSEWGNPFSSPREKKKKKKRQKKKYRLAPRPLLLYPAIPAVCQCLLFHFNLIVRSQSLLRMRTGWAGILHILKKVLNAGERVEPGTWRDEAARAFDPEKRAEAWPWSTLSSISRGLSLPPTHTWFDN